MAEIFLHNFEKDRIKHLIEFNILTFYTRYVDDILVVYDSTLTTPETIQRYLGTIHNYIQLSLTHETNQCQLPWTNNYQKSIPPKYIYIYL